METRPDPIARVLLATFQRCLQQALHELDVASRHRAALGLSMAEVWHHRLAPDMLCLAHQIEVLADGVQGTLAQLCGDTGHRCAGLVFNRGEAHLSRPAPTDAAALAAALRDALAATQRMLAEGPSAWQAGGTGPVLIARPGDARRYARDTFVWDGVLPNTLFHASMIHALLRSLGVPVGKADFIGPIPSLPLDPATT